MWNERLNTRTMANICSTYALLIGVFCANRFSFRVVSSAKKKKQIENSLRLVICSVVELVERSVEKSVFPFHLVLPLQYYACMTQHTKMSNVPTFSPSLSLCLSGSFCVISFGIYILTVPFNWQCAFFCFYLKSIRTAGLWACHSKRKYLRMIFVRELKGKNKYFDIWDI